MTEPIQADGPNLSGEQVCDLCGDQGGLVSQWTTEPFVHDYNVLGESMPMRYSYPWALCATCDALVSADDREGLREHVRGTERSKALYEEIESSGVPDALEVTRDHLDALHDDFWAHKIAGGPLTWFDKPEDTPTGEDVRAGRAMNVRMIVAGDEGLGPEATGLALDPDEDIIVGYAPGTPAAENLEHAIEQVGFPVRRPLIEFGSPPHLYPTIVHFAMHEPRR